MTLPSCHLSRPAPLHSAFCILHFAFALLLLVGCANQPAAPVTPATHPAPADRPTLQVPLAPVPPQVSADPADPAWSGAAAIDHLTLAKGSRPTDSALPTEIRLLWDRDWLYIRFINTGPEPYAPFGKERDALHFKGDAAEVFIDAVGDGKQWYELQQSPAGGLLDQNTTLTSESLCDANGRLLPIVFNRNYWPNLSYEIAGVRNAASSQQHGDHWVWIADFALPAKSILKRSGLTQYQPMPLRINLIRYHNTAHLNDPANRLIAMNWSTVVFGCPHQSPAAMGTITLVNNAPASR